MMFQLGVGLVKKNWFLRQTGFKPVWNWFWTISELIALKNRFLEKWFQEPNQNQILVLVLVWF